MVKIGLSARFTSQSPQEFGIGGKAIQYLEQSMANALARTGSLVFLIPSIGTTSELCGDFFKPKKYAEALDGLVLQGGVDISPKKYGEEALMPEITTDPLRDEYELALIDAFMKQGKPVLGICRGMQLINVFMGGSLYQDIPTQLKSPVQHYCKDGRENLEHSIEILPDTYLSRLYGTRQMRINSIHHQSVKQLGKGLVVEAVCAEDKVVEAIRYTAGEQYLVGVQWHPEFHDKSRHTAHLDADILFADFVKETRARERATPEAELSY